MKSPVSLYDALVSAQVPGDKARAAAEALESDMSEHLATKQDMLLLRKDVEVLSSDLETLRKDMDAGLASVRKDMDAGFTLVSTEFKADLAALTTTLTVRLGMMMAAGIGLLATVQQLFL